MNLNLRETIGNLDPKVRDALLGAGAGGIAGSLLGGVSAAFIPAQYDVTHSDFKLDGTRSKRRKYTKKFKRDPIGQAIRSGIIGSMIGGSRPFVEAPIRDWLAGGYKDDIEMYKDKLDLLKSKYDR
jgi:outer membrane lipoprotein SlyB